MTDGTTIEGEIINTEPEALPVAVSEKPNQVANFNPLAAEPVQFARELMTRKENYDNLAGHLRGMLIPGKDFGKIHIEKSCNNKWRCTDPYHFSPYTLFAPGADKILGVLSLGVVYPNEQDFIRAALKGNQIQDVIMSCHIVGGGGDVVISEGMGACSRKQENNDLNRTIKKACKRARVDAVMRLPAISALFEDDFLQQVERDAASNKGNSTTSRLKESKAGQFNTGARLTTMPIGKKMKGKKFADMDEGELTWILQNLTDKPDIHDAARRAYEQKFPSAGESDIKPETGPETPVTGSSDNDDWLSEYDAYSAQQEAPNG